MTDKKSGEERESHYTLSDLAGELDITPRTSCFYEEKGLISPRHSSRNHRLYSHSDRARLELVLRGRASATSWRRSQEGWSMASTL